MAKSQQYRNRPMWLISMKKCDIKSFIDLNLKENYEHGNQEPAPNLSRDPDTMNELYTIGGNTTVTYHYQSYRESMSEDFYTSLYILRESFSFYFSFPLFLFGFWITLIGILSILTLPVTAIWRIWNPACTGYTIVSKGEV